MTTLRRKAAASHGPLVVRFRPGLRLSDEAFWRLCCANPDLRLERSARGDLLIMPPAGADSDRRNTSATAQLWNWNQASGRGIVFGPSAGFTLPNTAVVGPDAAWMSLPRWEALSPEDREKFAHIAPDFVLEVRSRSDTKKALRDKMRESIAQGVRLAWLIDPKTRTVEIYRPGRAVEVLKQPATLSGEDVLPGFVLDLKGVLFD